MPGTRMSPPSAHRVQLVLGSRHETVHQDGLPRHGLEGQGEDSPQVRFGFNESHGQAPDDEARPDHEGVTQASGQFQGLLRRPDGSSFRLGNPEVFQDRRKLPPVLRRLDGPKSRPQERNADIREFHPQPQGGLSPVGGEHAPGLLPANDGQDILHRQGLQVEGIGKVVVGADRFRIVVRHDGPDSHCLEGFHRLHAAIVELYPLPDADRSRPQHHDRWGGVIRRSVACDSVGSIKVPGTGRCLARAAIHFPESLLDAQGQPNLADLFLLHPEQDRDVAVSKAQPLGPFQGFRVSEPALCEGSFGFDDRLHLAKEERGDPARFSEGLHFLPPPDQLEDKPEAPVGGFPHFRP